MATGATTSGALIIEAIAQHPGCCLDDLVRLCPELTWNQIFSEVDRLSRKGDIKLSQVGPGRYTLVVSDEGSFCTSQSGMDPTHPPVPTQPRHDTACQRCGGLMVSEIEDDFDGWRCILCGERVDPVILTQRRKSESSCRPTVQRSR